MSHLSAHAAEFRSKTNAIVVDCTMASKHMRVVMDSSAGYSFAIIACKSNILNMEVVEGVMKIAYNFEYIKAKVRVENL